MTNCVQKITVTQKFKTQPIYVNPEPDGGVTILDNTEVIEARKSYFGETFDTLQERLMNDFNGVLDKVGTVNYKDTTIHANNTYARNLVANRNKVEVLGQTIQNLVDDSNIWKVENTYQTDSQTNKNLNQISKDITNKINLKPNTTYTVFFDYIFSENTLADYYIQLNVNRVSTTVMSVLQFTKQDIDSNIKIKKFNTPDNYNGVNALFLGGSNGSTKFKNNGFMILEGDWTNKEVSYVPFGLNYPATTEVIATGKNILNLEEYFKFGNLAQYVNIDGNKVSFTNLDNARYYTPLRFSDKPINVTLSGIVKNDTSVNARLQLLKDGQNVGELREDKLKVENILADSLKLDYSSKGSCTFENLQLEINSVATEYEPYTERKVNINYPLASVSDTIRDRYYVKDGKKYHEQNVKEIVFDGSDDEVWAVQQYTNLCAYTKVQELKIGGTYNVMLCDTFILRSSMSAQPDGTIGVGTEGIMSGVNGFFFGIKGLATDVPTWRQYLKSNPVKIIFALKEPITTEIETEDMQSFDGQTNITTTNTVKPTLDIDIPSDLNAVVSNLMVENTSLKQENQSLTNELENQKAVNEENTLLMNTILGVE